MTTFKLGDIVEWAGVRGVVTKIRDNTDYPVEAEFKDTHTSRYQFTLDGKYLGFHRYASLVLVERPRKLVKKELKCYALMGCGDSTIALFSFKDIAEEYLHTGKEAVRVVELTGTYEVEEE